MKAVSELRQDLVSGDWVVVATGRAKRPHAFVRRGRRVSASKTACPFEPFLPKAKAAYGRDGRLLFGSARKRDWWITVVPNKYPAFGRGVCALPRRAGPYSWQDGVGFHEVVVTRDHSRSISRMKAGEVSAVLGAYRDRYRSLGSDDCVRYISIFHNHGAEAGATILHPHSQIIAIPVIPPDVASSLSGSASYFRRAKRCVHCDMLRFERRDKKRVVYENGDFTVICPYASRQAFETRIFPRRHNPFFETITDKERMSAADALRQALRRLDFGLSDPAYNFFIHTAPVKDGGFVEHYHWHMEIVPKTAIWAGFEIGTGIEISAIAPEKAAAFLRGIKS